MYVVMIVITNNKIIFSIKKILYDTKQKYKHILQDTRNKINNSTKKANKCSIILPILSYFRHYNYKSDEHLE